MWRLSTKFCSYRNKGTILYKNCGTHRIPLNSNGLPRIVGPTAFRYLKTVAFPQYSNIPFGRSLFSRAHRNRCCPFRRHGPRRAGGEDRSRQSRIGRCWWSRRRTRPCRRRRPGQGRRRRSGTTRCRRRRMLRNRTNRRRRMRRGPHRRWALTRGLSGCTPTASTISSTSAMRARSNRPRNREMLVTFPLWFVNAVSTRLLGDCVNFLRLEFLRGTDCMKCGLLLLRFVAFRLVSFLDLIFSHFFLKHYFLILLILLNLENLCPCDRIWSRHFHFPENI